MSTVDVFGCPVTAEPTEVDALSAAMIDYLTMAPGLDRHFDTLEQGGPMGRTMLAQMLIQSHRPEMATRASELVATVADQAADLSDRERGHLTATERWTDGDLQGTIDGFGDVLEVYPTDVLAFRTRYQLQFTTGQLDAMLAGVRDARAAWPEDLPLHSLLDGHEAFCLEELGDYRAAETFGRRGVERNQHDLWAIHAVAHVLEMQERREEGASWIAERDVVLEVAGGFRGHLWWHQAIQLWALGRADEVLDLYDRRVYPSGSSEGLDLSNAISLLVRLEIAGVGVGERWQQLIEPATARHGRHSHPFNDTHYALALARAGDDERLNAHLESMTMWSRGTSSSAEVLRVVGLETARGLAAFGVGRYQEAAAALRPVAGETWRLGGSHAQRQVYKKVLSAALARS